MERSCCAFLWNQHNDRWIKDVRDGLRFLRDECGVYSICWDQYILYDYVLYDIIKEYRTETQEMYPDADFAASPPSFLSGHRSDRLHLELGLS